MNSFLSINAWIFFEIVNDSSGWRRSSSSTYGSASRLLHRYYHYDISPWNLFLDFVLNSSSSRTIFNLLCFTLFDSRIFSSYCFSSTVAFRIYQSINNYNWFDFLFYILGVDGLVRNYFYFNKLFAVGNLSSSNNISYYRHFFLSLSLRLPVSEVLDLS